MDKVTEKPNNASLVWMAGTIVSVVIMGGAVWLLLRETSGLPREQQDALAILTEKADAKVEYDEEGAVVGIHAASPALDDSVAVHLVPLTDLRRLHLSHSAITDDGLRHLAGLTELEELHLEHTDVTAKGIQSLKHCEKLQMLILANTKVGGEALTIIGQLSELRLLDLSDTAVGDDGLEQLGKLSQLEALYLARTPVTGKGIVALRGLQQLQLLNLSGVAVDLATVGALSAFRSLEKLYLDDSTLNDELVPELMETMVTSNTKLVFLSIPQTPLTDSAVEPLKNLAKLPDLALVQLQHTQITKAAFQELSKAVPNVNFSVHYSLAD